MSCNAEAGAEGFVIVGSARQANELVTMVYRNHVMHGNSRLVVQRCIGDSWLAVAVAAAGQNDDHDHDDAGALPRGSPNGNGNGRPPSDAPPASATLRAQVQLPSKMGSQGAGSSLSPILSASNLRSLLDVGPPGDGIPANAEAAMAWLELLLNAIKDDCRAFNTKATNPPPDGAGVWGSGGARCWIMHASRGPYLARVAVDAELPDIVPRSTAAAVQIPTFSHRSIYVTDLEQNGVEIAPPLGPAADEQLPESILSKCAIREPTLAVRICNHIRMLELRRSITAHCLQIGIGDLARGRGGVKSSVESLPLRFDENTGQYVRLSQARDGAEAIAHGDGLCFGDVALELLGKNRGYQFTVRVTALPDCQHGFLSIGVTTAPPTAALDERVNGSTSWVLSGTEFIHGDGVVSSGYAADQRGLFGIAAGDTLQVIVDELGRMTVMWNGDDHGVCIHGVPISSPLYAVVDLYTSGTKVAIDGAVSPGAAPGIDRAPTLPRWAGSDQPPSQQQDVRAASSATTPAVTADLMWIAGFMSLVSTAPDMVLKHWDNAAENLLAALLRARPLALGPSEDSALLVDQISALLTKIGTKPPGNCDSGAPVPEPVTIVELRVAVAMASGRLSSMLEAFGSLCALLQSGVDCRLRVSKAFRTLPHQFRGFATHIVQQLVPIARHSPSLPAPHVVCYILGWIYSSCLAEPLPRGSSLKDTGDRVPANFCRFGSSLRMGVLPHIIEQTDGDTGMERRHSKHAITAQLHVPLSANAPYFEMNLASCVGVSVGVAPARHPDTVLLGATAASTGLHLDTGTILPAAFSSYQGSGAGEPTFSRRLSATNSDGPPLITVGCGLVYNAAGAYTGLVAFAVDGQVIGYAKLSMSDGPLFPTIALRSVSRVDSSLRTRWPAHLLNQITPSGAGTTPARLSCAVGSFDEFELLWKSYNSIEPGTNASETPAMAIARASLLLTIAFNLRGQASQLKASPLCREMFLHLLGEIDREDTFRQPTVDGDVLGETRRRIAAMLGDMNGATIPATTTCRTADVTARPLALRGAGGGTEVSRTAREMVLASIDVFFPDQQPRHAKLIELIDSTEPSASQIVMLHALSASYLRHCKSQHSSHRMIPSDLPNLFKKCVEASVREIGGRLFGTATASTSAASTSIVKFAAVLQEQLMISVADAWATDTERHMAADAVQILDGHVAVLSSAMAQVFAMLDKLPNGYDGMQSGLRASFLEYVVADFVQWTQALPSGLSERASVKAMLFRLGLGLTRVSKNDPMFTEFEGLFEPEHDSLAGTLSEWSMESSHEGALSISSPHKMVFPCPGATYFSVEFDPRTELDSHLSSERLDFMDSSGHVLQQVRGKSTREKPMLVLQASDMLRCTFVSSSIKDTWGFKFTVKAFGKAWPEMDWLADMLLVVASALGTAVGSSLFGQPHRDDAADAVTLELHEKLDDCSWAPLFAKGISANDVSINSEPGNGDMIFNVAPPSDVYVDDLLKLINDASNKTNLFWSARAGKIKVPAIGGSEIDFVIVAAFTAILHHGMPRAVQLDTAQHIRTLSSWHRAVIDHAIKLVEGLRPWLAQHRQRMKLQDESQAQASSAAPARSSSAAFFSQCCERVAILLSLVPAAASPNPRNPLSTNEILGNILEASRMVFAFIKDDMLPSKTTFKRVLLARTGLAERRLSDLRKLRRFTDAFGVVSPPSILSLRSLARWGRDSANNRRSGHFLTGCHGCGGPIGQELRSEYSKYIATMTRRLDGAAADKAGPNVGARWTAHNLVLQLLLVEWAPADFRHLNDGRLLEFLFQTAFTSFQACDRYESNREFTRIGLKVTELLTSVQFQAWQVFSSLLGKLTGTVAQRFRADTTSLLEQALITMVNSNHGLVVCPAFFLRIIGVLSQLCPKSQMIVAATMSMTSETLLLHNTSSGFRPPPSLTQACLKTFARAIMCLDGSFLSCIQGTALLEVVANAPFSKMEDKDLDGSGADVWESPSAQESSMSPSSSSSSTVSMEWGPVAMRAVRFLLLIGFEATAENNCRTAVVAAAAIRSICDSGQVNQFVTPLLRTMLGTCFYELRADRGSARGVNGSRVLFGLRVAASVPLLLSVGTQFRAMEEDDTVMTLVNFNPFTLSCTMYGPHDELVSKPAVVLRPVDPDLCPRTIASITDLGNILDLVSAALFGPVQRSTTASPTCDLLLKIMHAHLVAGGITSAKAVVEEPEMIERLYRFAAQSTGQHQDLLLEEAELLGYFCDATDIESEFHEVYSAEPRPHRNCSKKFKLRVRVDPDVMADVIGLVDPGESVLVVEHLGNWCKIKRKPTWLGTEPFAWAMHVATDGNRVRHLMLEPIDDHATAGRDTATDLPSIDASTWTVPELPDTEPIARRRWDADVRRRSRRASLPVRLVSDGDVNDSDDENHAPPVRARLMSEAPCGRQQAERTLTGTAMSGGASADVSGRTSGPSRAHSTVAIHCCARIVESSHPMQQGSLFTGSECIPGAEALRIEFAPECHTLNAFERRSMDRDPVASFLQQSVAEAFGNLLPPPPPDYHDVVHGSHDGDRDRDSARSSKTSPDGSPARPVHQHTYMAGSPGNCFKGYPGVELLVGPSDEELSHTLRGTDPWGSLIIPGDTVSYVFRTKGSETWGFQFRVSVHMGKPYSIYDEGLSAGMLSQERSLFDGMDVPPDRSAWTFKPTLSTSVELDAVGDAESEAAPEPVSVTDASGSFDGNGSDSTIEDSPVGDESDIYAEVQARGSTLNMALPELLEGVEMRFDRGREDQKRKKAQGVIERATPRDQSTILMKSILGQLNQLDPSYAQDVGHAAAILRARDVLVLVLSNWPSGRWMELRHVGGTPEMLFSLLQHTSKRDPAQARAAMASIVRHGSKGLLDSLLAYASTCVTESGKVTVRKRGPGTYPHGDTTYRDQVWIRGASKLTVSFDPSTFRTCHGDELTLATNWNLDDADDRIYTGFGTPTTPVEVQGDRLYIQYHSPVALTESQPWSFTVSGGGIGLSNVGLSFLSTYIRMIGTAFKVDRPMSSLFPASSMSSVPYLPREQHGVGRQHSGGRGSDAGIGAGLQIGGRVGRLDSLDSMDRIDRSLEDAVGSSPRTAIMWQSEKLNLLWGTLNTLVTQLRGRALLDCIRLLTDLLGIATPKASLDLRLIQPLAQLFRRLSAAGSDGRDSRDSRSHTLCQLEISIFLRTLTRLLFVVEGKALESGQLDHVTNMWDRSARSTPDVGGASAAPDGDDDSGSAWQEVELN